MWTVQRRPRRISRGGQAEECVGQRFTGSWLIRRRSVAFACCGAGASRGCAAKRFSSIACGCALDGSLALTARILCCDIGADSIFRVGRRCGSPAGSTIGWHHGRTASKFIGVGARRLTSRRSGRPTSVSRSSRGIQGYVCRLPLICFRVLLRGFKALNPPPKHEAE